MKNTATAVNTPMLQLEYTMAAAYYWYKASGPEDQLVSALNRMKANQIALKLGAMTPSAGEVKAWAVENWPPHQRHA